MKKGLSVQVLTKHLLGHELSERCRSVRLVGIAGCVCGLEEHILCVSHSK